MKKVEAYIKSERLKDALNKLKEIGVPGFTYYNVTGHGKEIERKGILAQRTAITITEDIIPRSKIEVICEDGDVEKVVEAIRGGCCTMKPGDGMAFVTNVEDAYRLKSKEKLVKIEYPLFFYDCKFVTNSIKFF